MHPELIEAVQLLEDQYFHYHPGVNPFSMARAVASLNSERRIGGSTVTMQMVRLKHKLRTRNVSGKFQQILYAFYYELAYSKKEILELYLNLTPYGGNIEGVEAASQIYFGKSASELSLLESLTLAVIPQNPLKRNLNIEVQKQVGEARNRLTAKWLEKHPEDALIIKESNLPVLSNRIGDLPFHAPHFVEEILKKYPRDHQVKTTLDLELQHKLEERLHRYLQGTAAKGVRNGSLLLIDAAKQEVKAWIGSSDFFDSTIQGQIDGVKINRSPGSTLKPLIYGRAIKEGLIHPGTMVKDSPSSFGSFDPENFDRKYLGPISATQALVQSRNVPAIVLASQIQPGFVFETLQNIGVTELQTEKFYGLGIAIGTAAMSSFNLGSLYTALVNRGLWQEIKLKTNAESFPPKEILTPESAFLTLDMLTHSPREHNAVLNDQMDQRFPMAWKTGTSYGFRDAWTVGVFGPYVLVVWLGNFDYTDNPELIGRDLAAPLFFQVADLFPTEVLNDNAAWRNTAGLNIKKVEVCEVSGGIPTSSCPHLKHEHFIPSVSPIASCNLHRTLMVSTKTGLRLCGQSNESFKEEVFEFWPSDVLEIFQKFGVKRKAPPVFDPSCQSKETLAAGISPEILSPKRDLKYLISFAKTKVKERIPLRAMTDGDVKELSWFVNQEFVGKGRSQDTLFYEAPPGRYNVIVVDDQGRTASRSFDVSISR